MSTEQENRRKSWNDLTESEKIERMRDIIKGYKREVLRLEDRIYFLENHKHLDSELVVNRNAANRQRPMAETAANSNFIYF